MYSYSDKHQGNANSGVGSGSPADDNGRDVEVSRQTTHLRDGLTEQARQRAKIKEQQSVGQLSSLLCAGRDRDEVTHENQDVLPSHAGWRRLLAEVPLFSPVLTHKASQLPYFSSL